MNYIVRLQAQNAALTARVEAMEEAITSARTHLTLEKFAGVDTIGDRTDWIATGDADRILLGIQGAGLYT